MKHFLRALVLAGCLATATPSHAVIFAQVIQYLSTEQDSGSTALIGAYFVTVDTSTGVVRNFNMADCAVTMATPKTWKDEIVACMIARAAVDSITLTAANVRWLMSEPGDFRRPIFVADWTQAATLPAIGTSAVNVYVGLLGLAQLAPFASYSHYRLVAFGNKIGTGNLTINLTDTSNAANTLTTVYSGAAGEFVQDSGWTALPAWAVGEDLSLKPTAKSSVGTDSPVFRQFLLYLK